MGCQGQVGGGRGVRLGVGGAGVGGRGRAGGGDVCIDVWKMGMLLWDVLSSWELGISRC
jgi:hypothetical protein